MVAGTGNTLMNNTATVGNAGFLALGSDNLVDGFSLAFCSEVTARKNVVSGSLLRDGIRPSDVVDSSFRENIVWNCANNGFSIDEALDDPDFPGAPSSGNAFVENASEDNGGFGYDVNEGTGGGHVYSENTCQGNGLGGSYQGGICD